jgi:hypothetical protein
MMAFIEWKLIHYKRRNVTVYESHPVDFISESSDGIYWKEILMW